MRTLTRSDEDSSDNRLSADDDDRQRDSDDSGVGNDEASEVRDDVADDVLVTGVGINGDECYTKVCYILFANSCVQKIPAHFARHQIRYQ